jgi:hypothetical protein
MTTAASPRFQRLRNAFDRLRTLHPPVMIAVRATPAECLQTLTLASRPRLERLHLRDLFENGRRYEVARVKDGFQVTSTARILWGAARARTPVAATVYGSFILPGNDLTLVRLHVGASRLTMLRSLFLPLWATFFVLALSWPLLPTVALIGLFLLMGWTAARLNAALQALEVVFFVQKVLADLPAGELPALAPARPDVIRPTADYDFSAAWQQFYNEKRDAH